MKKAFILGALAALSVSTLANIDLKNGFNGKSSSEFIRTIKTGQRITVDFGSKRYVEELLIFAEGKQRRFSFADVYADGELISVLGVPGFDPDYPVVVRGDVRKIEIVPRDKSKIAILDYQIYTDRKNYNSYVTIPRKERSGYGLHNFGQHALNSVHELYVLMRDRGLISTQDFIDYVQPIRRAAIDTQAQDNARDMESIKTFIQAKKLAEAINEARPLFDKTMILMDQNLDMLQLDLKTIKAEISETYDIDIE